MAEFFQGLRRQAAELLADVHVLARAIFDPDAPWLARIIVFLIVAYVLSPVDLIPDFIPVLGLLDELILVPLALKLAWRLMPAELLARYRRDSAPAAVPAWVEKSGAIIVMGIWVALIALAAAWIHE
ncbi:MAG: DUF1232 domain-containing protein [Gammaproteobacteria bacterium]|nr:DUF1232 domain-containing protein [Gammaproteobacteria bacterium]